MGHLPDNGLVVWGRGDQLTAEGLNGNFATLRDYAERALSRALMPDPAVVALEMRLGRIEDRLVRIEAMLTMHERQRNEREWAPLSHLGAVLMRLDALQQATEAAVSHLDQAHAEILAVHNDQHLRLSRLEQQPEAATLEQHQELAAEHREAAQKAHVALGQAIGLRQEVAYVRRIAEGHDRIANRREYAPMSTVAHLLERIMKLEQQS